MFFNARYFNRFEPLSLETFLKRGHRGYCVENKIEYICLKYDDYTPEAQALCDAAGVKIAVPGTNRTEKMLHALLGGAAIVGSEYYEVHYYERLLQDEKTH